MRDFDMMAGLAIFMFWITMFILHEDLKAIRKELGNVSFWLKEMWKRMYK